MESIEINQKQNLVLSNPSSDMEEHIIPYKTNNRYDYLLIFYISLIVFGVIGGAFQPIRIFIVIFAPWTLLFYLKDRTIRTKYLYEIVTFIVWIYYGCITLVWVIDITAGIKELTYLIINFIGVLLLIQLSTKANNPIRTIIKGWLFLIVITLPIALTELIFDKHLPMAILEADSTIGGIGIAWKYASAAFGNYNGYNVVIVYSLPFIFSSLFLYTKTTKALSIWIVLLLCALIILTNGSRGSFLCLSIELGVFLYYTRKQKVNNFGLGFFLSSLLISTLYFGQKIFFLIILRTEKLGLAKDTSRTDILSAAFQKLRDHYFLGVGAGNFQINLKYTNKLLTVAPHNLLFEVLIQYGPVITILFLIVFIKIIGRTLKNSNFISKYIVTAMLLCAPFATVIDSAYIAVAPVWMLIASLIVISDKQYYSDLR
jgi:hypothetical protein